MYYKHMIYITILVGRRKSKVQPPANFSQFRHWHVSKFYT